MKSAKIVSQWDTWHYLYLTDSESQRVFLSINETCRGWKRDGGTWKRYSGDHYRIPKPEIDAWLRKVAGHKEGETWECDRYYYEDEERPELPKGGGHRAWSERFICYPDRDGSYFSSAWSCDTVMDMEMREIRSFISFREGRIIGEHKAENLPVIFAMLFL